VILIPACGVSRYDDGHSRYDVDCGLAAGHRAWGHAMSELEHLPLTERIRKAEYFARELSEHLRQSYLPRLAELRSSSKVFDPELVSDQQMLDRMLAVLQTDEFAQDVYQKLKLHLTSIQAEMVGVLEGAAKADDHSDPDSRSETTTAE